MLLRLRTTLAAALERRRRPTVPEHDPFAVLAVQTRLGILAAQVQALEADHRAYGRARRIIATQAAYDAVLVEACHLAGVPTETPADDGALTLPEPVRFQDELELAARGWAW